MHSEYFQNREKKIYNKFKEVYKIYNIFDTIFSFII